MIYQRLIQFAAQHYVDAYENESGSVTVVNEFFNVKYIELVDVSTFQQLMNELGY